MATDAHVDQMLIEEAINSNKRLVEEVKTSAKEPGKQMSPEDFKAWLDKPTQH